jgi:hypothetical protein
MINDKKMIKIMAQQKKIKNKIVLEEFQYILLLNFILTLL